MARFSDSISAPSALIFDWHGTLLDTHEQCSVPWKTCLPQPEELGLVERLLPEGQCRTPDDTRLVRYIRIFRRLHPRILTERRVSRTDIFNATFGRGLPRHLSDRNPESSRTGCGGQTDPAENDSV